MNFGKHLGHAVRLGIVAAAIALAIPASASAQRGAGGGGGMLNNPGLRLWTALDQGFEDFAKELALTEEQTKSVTELVEGFREKNKDALGRWTSIMSSMRSRVRGAGGGGGSGERGAAAWRACGRCGDWWRNSPPRWRPSTRKSPSSWTRSRSRPWPQCSNGGRGAADPGPR